MGKSAGSNFQDRDVLLAAVHERRSVQTRSRSRSRGMVSNRRCHSSRELRSGNGSPSKSPSSHPTRNALIVTLIAMFALATVPRETHAQTLYAENRKPAGDVHIEYTLTIGEPLSHLYTVQVAITGIRSDSFDISMPAWAPGNYVVMDFARNVQRFDAATTRGRPLQWQQIDKETWRISKSGA